MKGDPIPDPDHVSRHCSRTRIAPGGRITGAAFLPRPDECLSLNWLEHGGLSDRDSQIQQIRAALSKRRNLGAQDKFAVINVGQVRSHVLNATTDRRNLRFLHEPIAEDFSHSEVCGFRADEPLIADLIAEMVLESHPARA